MGDWRLLSSRLAEDNLKKCLVADYRDFLYLAGATGVYIELGVPSILIEGVEIRNEEAEKHIALLEKGLEVAYAYQFMASAEAVLDSYNKRLRRLDPNEADLREIEALRDVVERGLEELDNYTLVLADPLRSMLHKGSSNRGLFLLERIVRRRVSYLHSVIWRRKRDAQETLLTLLSIILGSGLLSIMGAWSPLLTMILPIFPLLTMILLILMFFAIAAAILIGGPAIVYTIRDAIRRLRK